MIFSRKYPFIVLEFYKNYIRIIQEFYKNFKNYNFRVVILQRKTLAEVCYLRVILSK